MVVFRKLAFSWFDTKANLQISDAHVQSHTHVHVGVAGHWITIYIRLMIRKFS